MKAVTEERAFTGARIRGIRGKEEMAVALSSMISNLTNDEIVFFCIGTDRSTGDSFGPLIGSYLKEFGYTNVFGTIDEPVHAVNLIEMIESIPEGKKVIAIDACLGTFGSVGTLALNKGTIKPGAGVGKDLPAVGDYGITAIVNIGGYMEYFVLQNTRLATVMKMAKDVVSAILTVFPLDQIKIEESTGDEECQLTV